MSQNLIESNLTDNNQNFQYEKLKKQIENSIRDNEENCINQLEKNIKKLNNVKNLNLDIDIKSCVDQSFKCVLLSYAKEKNDDNFKIYEKLIDLSIETARREMCSGNLAVVMLTDLFDLKTTTECEKLFNIVEKRIEIWKEDIFFKSVKNQLLRTCNDLLRRLSRSQNTVFCGRILVFLANFFPFFERSGLNLISEFNYESLATFDISSEVNETITSNKIKDNEEEDGIISNESITHIDFDTYKKFWSLQEYFRMPPLCYKILHWKRFKECAEQTINLFLNFKMDSTNLNILDSSTEKHFFPKYLTSQKLLELQLCDSNFRRYILIQFLILFQYLIGKVKFKAETQVLNEEQLSWVKVKTDIVLNLISRTPSNGEQVKEYVSQILTREEFWSNWKNEACVELTKCNKDNSNIDNFQKINKRNLGEQIKNAEIEKKIIIGSSELNRIWNLNQDNMEACKAKERIFVPSIDEFFGEITSKVEYRNINLEDANFTWRALRLLSQRCSNFFLHTNNYVKPVKEYIEFAIERLTKDCNVLNFKSKGTDIKPLLNNSLPIELSKKRLLDGIEKESNKKICIESTEDKLDSHNIKKNYKNDDITIEDAEDISDEELLKQDDLNDDYKSYEKSNGNIKNGFSSNDACEFLSSKSLIIDKLAEKVKLHWKKLALKLKFKPDEVEEFEFLEKESFAQAKRMLIIWIEKVDPKEATLSNLRKSLEEAKIQVTI